jgi:molybdopterin synthase sulfur carrier subunit
VDSPTIDVTVRYFAAAKAAAGVEMETVSVPPGATVTDLLATLRTRGKKLAVVLERCSVLCDGIAVRNVHAPLQTDQIVDVLPPFAGG